MNKNRFKKVGVTLAIGLSASGVGAAMAPSASAFAPNYIYSNYSSISTSTVPNARYHGELYSVAKSELYDSVRNIQLHLNMGGIHVATDGVYGQNTKAAVIKAQKAFHLTPDGVVGPKTASAIGLHYVDYPG